MKKSKNERRWPKGKVLFLFGIIGIYLIFAVVFTILVSNGTINRSAKMEVKAQGIDEVYQNNIQVLANLDAAQEYFEKNFVENTGHINLYIIPQKESQTNLYTEEKIEELKKIEDLNTNSEAVSYYLYWTAQAKDKEKFDKQLEFVKEKMIHPNFGYMMWRLDANDTVKGDGVNIASDADLRTIRALMIAEEQWKDSKYTKMINELADGIEKVAVTKDGYLAPYGGASGENSTWSSREVWISYVDFVVLKEMSNRRGGIWIELYENMKNATLEAQIANGLYNSMLTESREYGNGIDGGVYSINSMWIMVRNAESGDAQLMASANKSLQFYKNKFEIDAELYQTYGSNGDAMSPRDTPWVYALVGRAAIALNDREFSDKMITKLIEKQNLTSESNIYGAFPEEQGAIKRVGQFTMQESIITLQDYVRMQSTT